MAKPTSLNLQNVKNVIRRRSDDGYASQNGRTNRPAQSDKKRSYPKEFKLNAVHDYLGGKGTLPQIYKRY